MRLMKVWRDGDHGVVVRVPEEKDSPISIRDFLCSQGIFEWEDYTKIRFRRLTNEEVKEYVQGC